MAEMLKVGDSIVPITIKDQFDREHKIGSESQWVVTWDKMTTRYANTYFEKNSSLLDQNLSRMIVDVSQTPSGIMSLFVLPRMRSYNHPILLSYDEKYNLQLPYKEERLTVLFLDEGTVERIEYVEDEAELEKILTP